MYPVLYVGFLCMGCVWERVWRLKTHWRSKEFSRVTREKTSREMKPCAQYMTRMRRVMTNGDNWFLQVFREILAKHSVLPICHIYLIHQVSTHTIYNHITHILKGMLLREKTLVITLESERLSYPQSSTQSIVVFLNSYLSISKSVRDW